MGGWAERLEEAAYGTTNPEIVCPHCHNRGTVRLKTAAQKVGLSGGKATAAILTGGLSVVVAGLSRKEKVVRAWCGTCRTQWTL